MNDPYGARDVKPQSLNHVVLYTTDRPRMEQFYGGTLGFKLSDTLADFMTFWRCNANHHSIALATRARRPAWIEPRGVRRPDWQELMRAVYFMGERGVRRMWGPGRTWPATTCSRTTSIPKATSSSTPPRSSRSPATTTCRRCGRTSPISGDRLLHSANRAGCPEALRGVVEDEAEGVAFAGADDRDAVTDGRGGPAARGLDRAVARGEDQAVAVGNQQRGAARLGAWALLQEQELAAGVVDAGLVEVDHDLEWEDLVAVQVAMERVPVAGAVAQQDRRRP